MPELRCQRCRFWVPIESISRHAGKLLCDQCRTQEADVDGEARAEIREAVPAGAKS